MSAYIKGKQSREEIINSSRQIFNEYGIHLTLVNLADLMDSTLGRLPIISEIRTCFLLPSPRIMKSSC
jgi:hypothetical protein